jgi:hypothetical protein
LALGTWRRKLPQLELALTGPFTEHHGRLIQGELELMELLERQIAELNEQIRDATEPFVPQLDLLQSIPGVQAIAARDLMGEIGSDMSRFGSAKRLSSWAGGSPAITRGAIGSDRADAPRPCWRPEHPVIPSRLCRGPGETPLPQAGRGKRGERPAGEGPGGDG